MARKPLEEHSIRKVTNIPTDLKTKAQEAPIIPVGRIQKPPPAKKVWTRLKSGLFGWKYTAQPTIPSRGSNSRTPGKSVMKESPKHKISETWRDKPPKTSFFGGGGKVGTNFSEKTNIKKQRDRILAEKSSTSEPNTGGHSGVSVKCGKPGTL